MEGDQAWVTLATNDSYALGALVVARSLKRVNTTRQLVVLVTPGVTEPMRNALISEFNLVQDVNVLDSGDSANLALLTRPELGITFTKLHCWTLTQFSKCVFLDADTLVLQNCDELFDREELSAAPDVGWPDCFNSGVFVFRPSLETYNQLISFAVAKGSFDGGDQGLLNLFFHDWSVSDISRHLPFIYNMVASATYSYLPAFKVFGAKVKIVHFIGPEKPWLMYFDTSTGTVRAPMGQEHLYELLQSWWDIFRSDVHRKLSPEMGSESHVSATVAEQVQESIHFHVPDAEASASFDSFLSSQIYHLQSQHQHQHSQEFQSQSHHSEHEQEQEKPKPLPQFHWVSVAIERVAPEYLSKPQESHDHHHHHSSPKHDNDNPQSHSQSESQSVQVPNQRESHSSESQERGGSGLAGAFAKISLEGAKSHEQIAFEEQMRMHAWESGHIDYMGKDSFDNIMKKIQASMAQAPAAAAAPQPEKPQEPPKRKSKSPSPPKPTPVAPAPTPEESEEARLAAERQALEKKLAEQKKIAEQKLLEEKQAAEARAQAQAPPPTPTPEVPAPAPAPQAQTAAEPPVQPQPAPAEVQSQPPAQPAAPQQPPAPVATAPPAPAAAPQQPPAQTEPAAAPQQPPSQPAPTAPAPAAPQDAPQPQAQAAAPQGEEQPVAPPRKQSKEDDGQSDASDPEKRSFGVGVYGVGLVTCVAALVCAIYYHYHYHAFL